MRVLCRCGLLFTGLLCFGLIAHGEAVNNSEAGAVKWHPAAGPLMTRWAETVSPQNVHAEYPRPQMVRSQWQNLNGLWQLELNRAADSVPAGATLPEQILVPFPVESALSGVMERADRLWYRRTFQVPDDWNGNRLLLHFGAVDWEATVYVNGKQLGTHRGGYDGFTFDITEALVAQADQELLVHVFDPTDAGDQPRGKQVREPKGIWYTPTTGIWQTVWMEPVPAARIDDLILTPDVDRSCLRLTAVGRGTGEEHKVRAVVRDGKEEVARAAGNVGSEIVLSIPKDRQKLWSPESPFLYDVDVTLTEGERPVDRVAGYFGLRKIEVAPDDAGVLRLHLNGKPLFQIGPLDQGFWPDGLYTAPSDDALRYDVEATRQLGFNMARKHVKIEPARWYYWCDKLGLLVWQDMPSGNNRSPESHKQFETELQRMIESRRNHPSIVMWVVFNEGWGQHDTERYVKLAERWDPTRLVNNASGWTDKGVGDVHDIHKYPGPAAPPREPDRAGVLGEFGGLGLPVPGHMWTEKHWGYRATADSRQLTRKYQDLLRGIWHLRDAQGLAAAVYTQTTDVETECNGLMTYDRAKIKVDVSGVQAANRGDLPKLEVLVPTSQHEPQTWRYTFDPPTDGWHRAQYDDQTWSAGPGGFGTEKTPGAVVRTVWNKPEIWLRRTFVLPRKFDRDALSFRVHHDEDVKIYLNGVLAAEAGGYTTDYEDLDLTAEGRAALVPGENVLAVWCKQTTGGQYIDVGMTALAGQ